MMRKSFFTLFFMMLLFLIPVHSGSANNNDEDFIKATIIFNEEIDFSILPKERITYQFDTIPALSVELNSSELNNLENYQNIKSIIKEKPVKLLNNQQRDWGHNTIGINLIHNYSYKGTNIKVAVLDTGVDTSHSDLNLAGGYNFIDNNSNYNDDNGHGTHVAGIIAALDNQFGVVGVAPKADLFALKFLDQNGEGTTADLAKAIDWSIENKMDILNMSFGYSGYDPVINELIRIAYQNGILIVGAAGNEGINSISYPANLSSVIAVGAINEQKEKAPFSNYGNQLEVVAPGVNIYSTYKNNSYAYLDGTSMASAYVSGYLALLKEKYPNKSNDDLRTLLHKNVLDLGVSGRDSQYGYGIIQSFINESPVSTKYIEATMDSVPIYDNRLGSLVTVGYLEKGQTYPIEGEYTNWYKIQFSDYYAYIRKSQAKPVSTHNLKNIRKTETSFERTFTAIQDVKVYDNTSGSLIPFATLKEGTTISVFKVYTSWVGVIIADRIGYVKRDSINLHFNQSDNYFLVKEDNVPIYDNSSGSLVKVGTLKKGQVYPRLRDYTDWHQIQFGNKYGYIRKVQTDIVLSHQLKNINKKFKHQKRTLTTIQDALVYDNTSGSLIPFAKIDKNVTYPIVYNYTKWVSVIIADRIGYIHKNDISLNFLDSDKYFRVIEDKVPVYDNRSGSLEVAGYLEKGEIFIKTRGYTSWHQIKFGNFYGYIKKEQTEPVFNEGLPKNITTSTYSSKMTVMAKKDTVVYDNSTGKLVPFSIIKSQVTYPIIKEYTSWYRVVVSGRIGYIKKTTDLMPLNF